MSLLNRLFGRAEAPSPAASVPRVWRQGDVFLIAVGVVPTDAVTVRPVLAEGEATGHSHALAPEAPARVRRNGADLYVEVTGAEAVVRHEEHGPITLPSGSYAVRIQREYHPKEIRRVVD